LPSFLYKHSLKGLSPQKLYSHPRKWFPWRALYLVCALMNNSSSSQPWEQKWQKKFCSRNEQVSFLQALDFFCAFLIFFKNYMLRYFGTALFDKSVLNLKLWRFLLRYCIMRLYYFSSYMLQAIDIYPVEYFVSKTKS